MMLSCNRLKYVKVKTNQFTFFDKQFLLLIKLAQIKTNQMIWLILSNTLLCKKLVFVIYNYTIQHMASKKISNGGLRVFNGDGEKSEKSLPSQYRSQGDYEGSDRHSVFNRNVTIIESNDKWIQDKSNYINRIKSLQQDLKSFKSRSLLWQKSKSEIINLNKYLKLSAVSLGCSDSALMKEFFQAINDLIMKKQDKNKDQRLKVVENKKKEIQLFERLVQANKKKYELQQKILQLENENQKLVTANDSLREKSRVQSSYRSSKIREFQQETMITIQEKDNQLSAVLERNNELKIQLIHYQQVVNQLKQQIQQKEKDLVETKDHNEQLYLECQAHKRQNTRILLHQKEIQMTLIANREQMKQAKEQISLLRGQLKKKKEYIAFLKNIIEEAKITNEAYFNQLQGVKSQEEAKRKESISSLVEKDQEVLKRGLRNNTKFAINRRRQNNPNKILLHSKSLDVFSRIKN